MKNNRKTRGWLPKETPSGFIKSTKGIERPKGGVTSSFWVPGIMIVASLISALLGGSLVFAYTWTPQGPGVYGITYFYSGLYAGILSIAASALGLSAGFLLLARKHIAAAVTSIAIVLSFGLTTLWLPTIDGQPWYAGSVVAAPMIVSLVALISVGINYRKLKQENSELPSTRERLLTGLGIAGGGLTVMGIVAYFAPISPKK